MTVVDFKEIPEAHLSTGDQDLFELFARDFFEAQGFRIIEGPGRGVDRGRDMLIGEPTSGAISKREKIWLLSAKHKAHSGKSVNDNDEQDPAGRVRKFKADGFIGFYSTLPSSGLDDTFSRLKTEIDIYPCDRGRIEHQLVSLPELSTIFQRYFPASYRSWSARDKNTVQVWDEITPLNCCNCERNILLKEANIVLVYHRDVDKHTDTIYDVYWACKRECDKQQLALSQSRFPGIRLGSRWDDISDLRIPFWFIRSVIGSIRDINLGYTTYTEEALKKYTNFIALMSQAVLKESTKEQRIRLKELLSIS